MADDKETKQGTDAGEDSKDAGKLPTPSEKYKQSYEADRKRLAEEHGNG